MQLQIKSAYLKFSQHIYMCVSNNIVNFFNSQVTEEEQCEDSVFCLAMNLVDRFLSRVDVKKAQLQLLGCVCLLLASKMRQSRPLTVDRLVYFSDFSISASDIRVSCIRRNAK